VHTTPTSSEYCSFDFFEGPRSYLLRRSIRLSLHILYDLLDYWNLEIDSN
jgi:hypothetical protein